MKPQRRFIASIIATARTQTTRLPFERGAPRAERIARRNIDEPAQDDRAAARA